MAILAAIFPSPPPSCQEPLPDQTRKESGCIISQIKAEGARSQEPDAKGSACAHGPYLMTMKSVELLKNYRWSTPFQEADCPLIPRIPYQLVPTQCVLEMCKPK